MIKVFGFLFDMIFEISNELLVGIFGFITSLFENVRKIEHDANFVSVNDLLKREDTGFCVDGISCLSVEESFKNCITLGGSGSGKSSTILINSVLYMMHGNSSFILNDPSLELRNLLSGALLQNHYEVKLLDYTSEKSECFNPIARCKSVSDIQKACSLLVNNVLGNASDKFWSESAISLLSIIVRYLVFYAKPEYRNMHNALYLVNLLAGSPEKVDRLIVYTRDEKLLSEYKAFISYGDKTLSGIIASVKAALNIFSDDVISKITSHDTLDFKKLRQRKTAIFINNNISDMKYFSPLSALFFQQLTAEILSSIPSKDQLNIFFLIDEAGSIYLPNLSVIIANIRKYRAGIMLVYQDYHIIEHLYGSYEAKNISANAYKIYLPGQPLATCKELEATLGIFEYLDENGVKRTRALMTSDEIRMSNRAIILLGNKSPIHAELHPYYLNPKLKKLTELPPYAPSNSLPFDIPPLIPIYENKKEE